MTRQIQVGGVAVGGGAAGIHSVHAQYEDHRRGGAPSPRSALWQPPGARLPAWPCRTWRRPRGFGKIAAASAAAPGGPTSTLTIAWPSRRRRGARPKFASTPATSAGKTGSRPWWTAAKPTISPSESASTAEASIRHCFISTAIPRRKLWWRAPFPTLPFWKVRILRHLRLP